MSEFTFDASITVEAETEDKASTKILDALMDIHAPTILYKDGCMPNPKIKELEAENKRQDNIMLEQLAEVHKLRRKLNSRRRICRAQVKRGNDWQKKAKELQKELEGKKRGVGYHDVEEFYK